MANDDEWVNEAKARLARAKPRKPRAGSVAARVEALLPEMAAARAAGKTWEEIAGDLSDDRPFNQDAVRIAYVRADKRSGTMLQPVASAQPTSGAPASRPTEPPALIREVAKPGSDLYVVEDMFAEMFDPRDTRGRNTSATGERRS